MASIILVGHSDSVLCLAAENKTGLLASGSEASMQCICSTGLGGWIRLLECVRIIFPVECARCCRAPVGDAAARCFFLRRTSPQSAPPATAT